MSLNQKFLKTSGQGQTPFGKCRALVAWGLPVKNAKQMQNAFILQGRQSQSGRSALEMLGVLAVIGVLTVGGVAGYRRAVNSYEVDSLLFSAKQYASQIFMGRGTRYNEDGQPVLPTPKELGLNPYDIGMYPTDDYLKDNGVELHLSFYNQNHCTIAAELLNTRCQLVSKGAMCRQIENAGVKPDDLNRVVGCFDYVFHDN